MKISVMGDAALLLHTGDEVSAQLLRDSLYDANIAGVCELVPAADTMLLTFDPLQVDVETLTAILSDWHVPQRQLRLPASHVIDVKYDGEDLESAARFLGISVHALIERHQSGQYTVAFLGFLPGFAYMTGVMPSLRVPRHQTPRVRVPAGAVAIADGFTGIYPVSSPGGWQILGHATANLFDPASRQPAFFSPGDRVRFRAS